MRSEPSLRPSLRMRSIWKLTALLNSITLLILPITYLYFMYRYHLPSIWLIIISCFVFIEIIFLTCFLPSLRMKYTAYEIYETELEIQTGIFIIKRVVIPMVRVQHVTTEVGPLLRKYGLSTINISTAATVHKIAGLEHEIAEELRDKIIFLARISDDDV